ncbi:phosphate/phosphite/phosphonate ABC transporter substrate-binding protein [Sulfuricurvum sp.]|uniref:phosphate/phosphite/phosphonate ABC transporter substrate-binding protein n=1 Tax=Sulfuricurvum sp. TaxID=2025608 RepID=UPI0027340443|nr:phosphate/phosphite/phosphonate ABC transporter substrate-binding protein [Sulfuricurvum sp.]
MCSLQAATPLAKPFLIGVAPHTSARIIIEMYQPLRNHLEKTLQQPVEIVTAPDFTEFARRAMAKQYDLVVTTGHQVRLLQSDAAYLPLLTYQADFRAVLLVAADSPYHRPADLAGTTVFGLSPSSLVTLWGQHWLHRNAVPNVTLSYTSASDSTVALVLKGTGSAAFISFPNYHSLPAALQGRVRFLDESLPMAGRVYALAPRQSMRKTAIETALWAFAKTPEAQAYFTRFKLEGYRPLKARELVEMEPYANEVRQLLKRP